MTFHPNKYGYAVIGIVLLLLIVISKNEKLKSKVMDTINYLKEKTWDYHTDRRVAKLHPGIRAKVNEFIIRAKEELGIHLRVSSGYRSFEEQTKIYNSGRSETGKILSHSKAGESFHNYGLAIDVVEIKNGKALWKNPNWNRIADLGKQLGFEWGGDWRSFKDKPHFQYTYGFGISELKRKYDNDEKTGDYLNLV